MQKRRILFIKKAFQWRLIIIILLIVIIMANVTGGLIFAILKLNITSEGLLRYLNIRSSDELLLPAIILAEVIGFVIIFFVALFVSHRMAGPIYRFEKVIEQIGKGDFTIKTTLRKKDEFHEIAEALNDMLLQLTAKIEVIKEQSEQLKNKITELKLSGKKKDELARLTQELEASLKSFKIDEQ